MSDTEAGEPGRPAGGKCDAEVAAFPWGEVVMVTSFGAASLFPTERVTGSPPGGGSGGRTGRGARNPEETFFPDMEEDPEEEGEQR